MVKVATLFLSLSIAFASVSATRGGDDSNACPKGYKLQHVQGFQWGGCECIDEFYKSAPLTKGWSVSAVQNKKGGFECRPRCDEPPPPTPSGTPGHGGGHGGHGGDHGGHGGHDGGHDGGHGGHGNGNGNGDNHGHGGKGDDDKPGHDNGNGSHGHWKRRQQQSLELCPKNTLACQISIPGVVSSDLDVECVHAREDLYNCGACGNSCLNVKGINGTACVAGKCEVYSCAPGFQLKQYVDGTSTCQAAL